MDWRVQSMGTEKEKMLQGKIYDPSDEELVRLRQVAHRLSKQYNDTCEEEEEKRKKLIVQLIPEQGEGCYFQGPIYFDYGVFTRLGNNVYANFNFTMLDTCPVTIGNNVYFGPNCTVATPIHPMLGQERLFKQKPDGTVYDDEYGKAVTIGSNCWIASNVVICAGVRIGDNCVIGAGSVVTKDIPPDSFAAGSPCRVIRAITEADSIKLKQELW